MPLKSFLYIAPAAMLFVACSRQPAVTTAAVQNPSPEPVERTAPPNAAPSNPYDNPVPYAQTAPAPAAVPPGAAPSEPSAYQPAPRQGGADRDETSYSAIIPAGTPFRVRLDESVGTRYDRAGERFSATLSEPVMVDGRTLLPPGTRFAGHVTESKPSGRLKGRAVLALRLDTVDLRGEHHAIDTDSFAIASHGRKGHDFRWIGGGGGLGAVVGAIAGGGEGALVGAAAGAGAGTAGALVTHRKEVGLRAETPLTFRLRAPIVIR